MSEKVKVEVATPGGATITVTTDGGASSGSPQATRESPDPHAGLVEHRFGGWVEGSR